MSRGKWLAATLLFASSACGQARPAAAGSPLLIERSIPLPDTKGQIDHLAIDLPGRRLFVAEVANGTVDEIDLAAGRVVGRIGGLKEPQGVGWLPAQGEIVVACGDGSVRFYSGRERHEVARIDLGDDADNVRIDPRSGFVVVGYGSGGLATIDPGSHRVLRRLTFQGHPEGFRLFGSKAYINVPDRRAVLVADLDAGHVLARWPTSGHWLNFPLAVDPSGHWIEIAYRFPAALQRIDAASGQVLSTLQTCGDADDLFLAGPRSLVICGAGHVDVVRDGRMEARVDTGGGARTGLYVAELQRLFVAVPARDGNAAIRIMRLTVPSG